jgi:hypothetical protein
MTRNDRVIVNSGAPDGRPVRRTSWGAVFAGALTALMVTLLLNLLFAGIGLQSFNPASEANTLEGFGTGSIVALVLTNVIALFLGGYIAGRLAGSPRRGDSVIHGILTWGVLTLGTILLLSTAIGRIVGGVAGVVGSTVSTVATVAPEAANAALPGQGLNVNNVQDQINQFLADAGVQNPEQTSQELIQRVTERIQNGESLTSPEAQEEFTTFLAQNSELSEQEIEQQVQQFTQQAQQTADQVVETTEEATDIAGNVAFALFGALLLGALIAIFGAIAGSPKDSYEARA